MGNKKSKRVSDIDSTSEQPTASGGFAASSILATAIGDSTTAAAAAIASGHVPDLAAGVAVLVLAATPIVLCMRRPRGGSP